MRLADSQLDFSITKVHNSLESILKSTAKFNPEVDALVHTLNELLDEKRAIENHLKENEEKKSISAK